MTEQYAGTLSDSEPLYHFLTDRVVGDVLGYHHHKPIFDVFCLDNSATVYRFADRQTFVNLIGKFYGNKWINGKQTGDAELRAELMQREFENLKKVRELGFDTYPHSIVRPLSVSQEHNCVLVEEFVPGMQIDFYIREAIQHGFRDELYKKLADLAWFLADLHIRTQTTTDVDQSRGLAYYHKVIDHLSYWKIISPDEQKRFLNLADRWASSQLLNTGFLVLTHGDPIFPHFFCSGEHGITSIDLERVWPGDRAMDIGCIVAELKHLFFLYSHDIWASEPFIQFFYDCYFNYLPDAVEDFRTLTSRGQFYMGCYELRISRNDWLDLGYRRALINEAEACLQI
jgi:hypothetical protein